MCVKMKGHKKSYATRSALCGASLIEVLVSIVIASIGLLALAGVNAASMRYTKMSQYRATATQLASDIGERMRANKAAYVAGNYDFTTDFAGQSSTATLPADPNDDLCNRADLSCTPAKIAAFDLAQWRILVRDQLPQGSAILKRDAAAEAMDVWVVWRDPAVADADDSPALATECPDDLSRESDLSVRCSYFRVNL